MSTTPNEPRGGLIAERIQHELVHLQTNWLWFMLLGALLILCGMVAIVYPFVAAVGVIVILAATLLIGGVAIIISSFWAGKWSAFLLQLLIGILYVVVGMSLADKPLISTAALTLFIAAFFMVAGIFRVVAALAIRFPQWGWTLLNGGVTFLLGALIYRHFPESAIWVIGTLVGVDMLFNGVTWVMLALELRNLCQSEERAAAE